MARVVAPTDGFSLSLIGTFTSPHPITGTIFRRETLIELNFPVAGLAVSSRRNSISGLANRKSSERADMLSIIWTREPLLSFPKDLNLFGLKNRSFEKGRLYAQRRICQSADALSVAECDLATLIRTQFLSKMRDSDVFSFFQIVLQEASSSLQIANGSVCYAEKWHLCEQRTTLVSFKRFKLSDRARFSENDKFCQVLSRAKSADSLSVNDER